VDTWFSIIDEAASLGVFYFVLAGGEPFLFKDLLRLCQRFSHRLFIVLSNGTVVSKDKLNALQSLSNIVVLLSIEGGRKITDARRGDGIYEQVMNSIDTINETGTPVGISVTITSDNYRYWMDEAIIDMFIMNKVKIAVFIEYIPTSQCSSQKNDHDMMLSYEQREEFRETMLYYRENKNIYIIHSPGDEEFFGGCISAGRGFAHVTPSGDLTPCPISDVATHNLTRSSLKEGLSSPLFEEIRKNEQLLETNGMPCALFAHPKEVDELARKVNAYRTHHDTR
jgi:MoaA/NifB/PqqE/SkfB family radical SAM enzyme